MSTSVSVGRVRGVARRRWIASVVLLVVSVGFLLPAAWLLLSSIDPEAGLSTELPATFTFENFASVMNVELLWRPMAVSLILSGGGALIAVVVAILAAYPLSRFNFKINNFYMYAILFASGLPIIAMMVPVYSVFVSLGMIDSIGGTTFFLAATQLPMSVFMMKTFMDNVPVGLEEAAWIDGASRMVALRRIVVPLLGPGIATVSIFVFVMIWGNFFVPFILLLSPVQMPLAVTIFAFFGQHGQVGYGQIADYSILYTIPAIVLYLIVSRRFGLFALAGGVKG